MSLPTTIFTFRWLIQDTFRQARASGIFWLMLGLSIVCILFCLSVGTENVPAREPDVLYLTIEAAQLEAREEGIELGAFLKDHPEIFVFDGDEKITFLFGAQRIQARRPIDHEIRQVQFYLAQWGAGTAGVLLALVWTAGFLPTFLQPSSASVLLAKPVTRTSLLAGKYVGVLTFVAFQLAIFFFGTWLALGLATGVWAAGYLLCLPVVLIHFGVFFSFSLLLAVATRSTVACVLGSLVFWLVCSGMNGGRHFAVLLPDLQQSSPLFVGMVELGYWVLPKPADMGIMLLNALDAPATAFPFHVSELKSHGAWHPELSLLSSCAFAVGMIVVAARDFMTADY